jgi:hypothetical protein
MNTQELENILRWEENWFHEVNQTVPLTRLTALRLVRHAIWYLRSRHRDPQDIQAANVLLRCLAEMRTDSIRLIS